MALLPDTLDPTDTPFASREVTGIARARVEAIPDVAGVRHVRLQPRHGYGTIDVPIRFRLSGSVGAPLLVVLGGISAGRDVLDDPDGGQGWWRDVAYEGGAIDPRRHRVLGIDWLDTPLLTGARAVDSTDQADALAALLDELALGPAHALIGSSYGAMVGLQLAARHPDCLRQLVAISGAHRAHPMATALRGIQREIVRLGLRTGEVDEALSLARQLAMTTYRGSEEFGLRFDGGGVFRDDRYRFPVEDYLQAAGRRFVARFDAARFLSLSESIDLHRVNPGSIHVPTTVIAVGSDRLVPAADLEELHARLAGPRALHLLDSPYGHDAFLKEPQRIGALLSLALNR